MEIASLEYRYNYGSRLTPKWTETWKGAGNTTYVSIGPELFER